MDSILEIHAIRPIPKVVSGVRLTVVGAKFVKRHERSFDLLKLKAWLKTHSINCRLLLPCSGEKVRSKASRNNWPVVRASRVRDQLINHDEQPQLEV